MPLKFYYTEWAKTLFRVIGGAETARALHRFGAMVTFLYFGLHVTSLDRQMLARAEEHARSGDWQIQLQAPLEVLFGPDSMMPTMQDWRDFVAHNKWFFGKGAKPQFDRWTYWEKFDYFAVFWGVFIIGSSGLVMWFPDCLSPFLPGWLINVALNHPLG